MHTRATKSRIGTQVLRVFAILVACVVATLAIPNAVSADTEQVPVAEQPQQPTIEQTEQPPTVIGDGMTIYAVNLGNENNGDAVIVECGTEILLMDLGSAGAFDRVAEALNEVGAPKKDDVAPHKHLSLYFSHFHSDHTGGIGASGSVQQLLNTYAVDTVYLPDNSIFRGRLDGSAYLERGDRIRALAQEKQYGCRVVGLQQGSTFTIGDAQAVVIGPVGVEGFSDPGPEPQPTDDENTGDYAWDEFVNNCSLVTRITYGNVSYLTSGDAKEEAEAALVAAYGQDLKADIFKLAHHALKGNTEEFLSCIQPTYSFAMNNGYTELQRDGTTGLNVRRTYFEKQRASAYGLCYMIGEEEDGLVIRTDGMSKLCYRHNNQGAPLAGGVVQTVGSYGEDRGGGCYDLNDYYYLDDSGTPVAGVHNVAIEGVEGYRKFDAGGKICKGTWSADKGSPTYHGWITYEDGSKQYIYQDSAIIGRGFCDIDGQTYYFSPTDDCHMTTGIQLIGEYFYQFDATGKMVRASWYNDESRDKDHWMYFGKDGTRASGWMNLDGATYYLDAVTGYRATGAKRIGAYYFQFNDKGKMLTSCWCDNRYYLKNGQRASGLTTIKGKKYYLDPLTGYRASGLKRIGEYYYYFRKSTGAALTNVTKTLDGYECTFDKYGIWTNPPRIARPELLSANAAGDGSIQLTWNAQDVDGYEVFRSSREDGEFRRVLAVKDGKATSYTASLLKPQKTYYFKIRSYRTVLGPKLYSSFSDIIGATTP